METNTSGNSSEVDMKPSLIYKNGHWTDPPTTSTDSQSCSQDISTRYAL